VETKCLTAFFVVLGYGLQSVFAWEVDQIISFPISHLYREVWLVGIPDSVAIVLGLVFQYAPGFLFPEFNRDGVLVFD